MFDLVQGRELGRKTDSPTTVCVITHAEPDPKKPKQLSERGRSHLQELLHSRLISDVAHVYSGNEKIVLQTAGIIRRFFNAKVSVNECLNDLKSGSKLTTDQWIKIWSDYTFEPSGSESINSLVDRVIGCTIKIVKNHPFEIVVLVTSPIVSAALYHFVTGFELTPQMWLEIGIPSCAIYDFTLTQWGLSMPPDNSFLTDPIFVQDILNPQLVEQLQDPNSNDMLD